MTAFMPVFYYHFFLLYSRLCLSSNTPSPGPPMGHFTCFFLCLEHSFWFLRWSLEKKIKKKKPLPKPNIPHLWARYIHRLPLVNFSPIVNLPSLNLLGSIDYSEDDCKSSHSTCSFAMWICHSSHQEMESIFPSLDMWLALTDLLKGSVKQPKICSSGFGTWWQAEAEKVESQLLAKAKKSHEKIAIRYRTDSDSCYIVVECLARLLSAIIFT